MRLVRKDIKGHNGKVLIIGGSQDYIGAPALAGMAALRTGVDLVTICAPEKVAWTINSYSPDLITKKFLGEELNLSHTKDIIMMSEKFDVVLLGPGLGIKKDFVLKLLRDIKKPFVIDADAIKTVSVESITNSLFTPHLNEFGQLYMNSVKKPLFDSSNIEQNIKAIQQKLNNCVILLKGKSDVIFSKHRRHVNKTGHNSMTVGGTGDILAGISAGYLAQSKNLFESAKLAAFTCGKLGEYMYKQKGYSYTAHEMINEIWRFVR
jgi:ADP-dependent NAD(P)H-hydrate dehydratase / NAD(P)H-hydrate epimerase